MSALLLLVLTLIVIATLILLFTEYRVEVKPATALVYNNKWTGRTACVLPGTDFIVPGIHEVLEGNVSLKNEAENPSNVKLITADGVELEVDYIVRRLQVGYPDMPKYEDPTLDQPTLRECVIHAVTVINYKNHRDLILTRVVAQLQAALERRTLNELVPGTDLTTGQVGIVNTQLLTKIEEEVNQNLLLDLATTGWGFWVEIDLEDLNLPTVIRQAREQRSAAEIAGKAIADKAKAAGVDAKWIVAAEVLGEVFRGKR